MPRFTICLTIAFFVSFAVGAWARGRSLPIEITGTIIRFDRAYESFTIQADEPARVLAIAVGRDCKFKSSARTITGQILRPGAQVKVSYFATIFSGNIAVEIESNPRPEVRIGIVERIDPVDRKLHLRIQDPGDVVLRWASNARFLKNGREVPATALRRGTVVTISYFSPAFAPRYAVKLELK